MSRDTPHKTRRERSTPHAMRREEKDTTRNEQRHTTHNEKRKKHSTPQESKNPSTATKTKGGMLKWFHSSKVRTHTLATKKMKKEKREGNGQLRRHRR